MNSPIDTALADTKFDGFAKPTPTGLYYFNQIKQTNISKNSDGLTVDDHTRFFWEDSSTKLQISEFDNYWELSFSKLPGAFFSLSWRLTLEEVEFIEPNTIVAMGTDLLEPIAAKPKQTKFYGKLSAVKGRRERTLEREGQLYDERYQVGFNMREKEGTYFEFLSYEANKVWFDFLVADPRYLRWKIGKPTLWFQKLNPF